MTNKANLNQDALQSALDNFNPADLKSIEAWQREYNKWSVAGFTMKEGIVFDKDGKAIATRSKTLAVDVKEVTYTEQQREAEATARQSSSKVAKDRNEERSEATANTTAKATG